jgi:hypothetical protein
VPASWTWDIGGPDVLEYGDMMQIYAQVAGLRRRFIVVLPFLTPTIASLWVGLVTPIPAGLARPLVESLHCDAVVNDHDIDAVIPPPPGGLTGYRDAVSLALLRVAQGRVETTWAGASPSGSPSEPLPSDPQWAGAIAHTITRSAKTAATTDELWKAVDTSMIQQRWRVQAREPGRLLRMITQNRIPGHAWLDMRVESMSGNKGRYDQRLIFYPRGIAGRVYWYGGLPLHRRRFRATFGDVVAGLARLSVTDAVAPRRCRSRPPHHCAALASMWSMTFSPQRAFACQLDRILVVETRGHAAGNRSHRTADPRAGMAS